MISTTDRHGTQKVRVLAIDGTTELQSKPQRWGCAPTEELPLRGRLPEFRADTRRQLTDYAQNQWATLGSWLLNRQLQYWQANEYPADLRDTDELHRRIDACCALDLLEWQSGCATAKQAVEWLANLAEAREQVSGWAGEKVGGAS